MVRPAASFASLSRERRASRNLVDRRCAGGSRGLAQRRRRFDGAGVRSPGRKNGPLLVDGQISVGDHIARMSECSCWMQQVVEVEFERLG
jgi:hypothetical protein